MLGASLAVAGVASLADLAEGVAIGVAFPAVAGVASQADAGVASLANAGVASLANAGVASLAISGVVSLADSAEVVPSIGSFKQFGPGVPGDNDGTSWIELAERAGESSVGPCDEDSSTRAGPDTSFNCIVRIIPQRPGGPSVGDGDVSGSSVTNIPGGELAMSMGYREMVTKTGRTMYVVGKPHVGVDDVWFGLSVVEPVFSSTVPSGSGAFQMPTRPSSVASTWWGKGQSQKRFSNFFSFFWHEASLGCH